MVASVHHHFPFWVMSDYVQMTSFPHWHWVVHHSVSEPTLGHMSSEEGYIHLVCMCGDGTESMSWLLEFDSVVSFVAWQPLLVSVICYTPAFVLLKILEATREH